MSNDILIDVVCRHENATSLSDLHFAVMKDNIKLVESIIAERNFLIDVQTESGNTSLILACLLPVDTQIAKKLIESGADVNVSNVADFTPLLAACREQKVDLVKLLLEKGADINHQDDCGYSALSYAMEKENLVLVDLLLHSGIDTNLVDINGWDFLMMALHCHDSCVLKVLPFIEDVNKIASNGWSPLMLAALNGNKEIVTHLVERGADVNIYVDGVTPALLAAEHDDLSTFEFLWSSKTVEVLKENNELQNFIKSLFNSQWVTPHMVPYLYKILDTPGINFEGGYLRNLSYYVADLKAQNLDQEIDVLGIVNKLCEKNAEFIDLDVEGFISISCIYSFEYKYKLLQLLIRSGADFNLPLFLYMSANNDPEFTITLLQYLICSKPSDLLEHVFMDITRIQRANVSIFRLIRFLLKICTPSPNLKEKMRKNISPMGYEEVPHAIIISSLEFMQKRFFTLHHKTEELKLVPHIRNDILELLSKDSVPSLKELSRDKIRECLAKSCLTTQDYLHNLKALHLPQFVTDIIRCKNTVVS